MKKWTVRKLFFLSIITFLFFSCANRNNEITKVLNEFDNALNTANLPKFQSLVYQDAEDYNKIDQNWLNAITITSFTNTNGTKLYLKYYYKFVGYEIPESGNEITVTAETVIKAGGPEEDFTDVTEEKAFIIDYRNKSDIKMIAVGGFLSWGNEWKVKKLNLPAARSTQKFNVLKQIELEKHVKDLKTYSLFYMK